MKTNKKKGAALLSVIVLLSVVVSFSLVIFALIINSNATTAYISTTIKKEIVTNKIFADFVDNQVVDGEYDFDIDIYTAEENANIKAVVVKKNGASAENLYFYGIYDFENEKALAKQAKNFELTTKVVDGKTYYYLADIVKYKEV